jgi:hypothetical protein
MKRLTYIFIALALMLALLPTTVFANGTTGPVTKDYGDYSLSTSPGYQFGTWNLNKGPVTITYTLDLSGAPNVGGTNGQVGLLYWSGGAEVAGALMTGYLNDVDNPGTEFPTFPDKPNTLDLDDKFNLQRFPNPGSWSETQYDVVFGSTITKYASPIGSGDNYGIWFDRDGVDPYQASGWGAVDGGTYNTGGIYKVQLTFSKLNTTTGVVQPVFFPELANDDAPDGYGVPTGFDRLSGGGYDYFPAGISFATDETKMAAMRVLVQGNPGNGTIVVKDLEVTGYSSDTPVTTNVVADPNPAPINTSVQLSATVESKTDVPVGFADYSLDGGTTWQTLGTPWLPNDGTLDVSGDITAPATPGIYDLCVRGVDYYWNYGEPECTLLVVYDPDGGFVTGGGWITSPEGAMSLPGPVTVWDQDFSTDASGWFGDGINVDGGVAELSAPGGQYSHFDGYRDVWPGTYTAEIDVYLDPSWPADQGFDYSVASSGTDGLHQRDFIFHVGTVENYGPIVGKELLVAVDNNAYGDTNEYVLTTRPGGYYVVPTAGWYTLQHVFYDAGGYLAVDFNILDSNGNVVWSDTVSNTSDTIPDEVGGNRYAWFVHMDVAAGIRVDNHQLILSEVPSPEGKATFGFVSKYKKGADVPVGNTEFQFKAGDLNFHSSDYDWLVVTGSDFAKFKGTGTINGEGTYKFQIWAGDGDPDTFRIKIWDAATDVVVYDNGMKQEIGGGSIVVHKK